MKKLLNLALIAVITAAFVVPGFADEKCKPKKMEKHHHGKEGLCSVMAKLNLTDDQKTEIDKLRKLCMETKKEIQTKMAKLQDEIHKLMAAEKPDKKLIYQKIDESGKLSIEMKKKCMGQKLEIKALLTSEQLKKWEEMKSKEECGHHKHGEEGHHNKHEEN